MVCIGNLNALAKAVQIARRTRSDFGRPVLTMGGGETAVREQSSAARICPLPHLRLLPQPSGPASKAPQRCLQIFWAKTSADKDDGAVFGLIFLRG